MLAKRMQLRVQERKIRVEIVLLTTERDSGHRKDLINNLQRYKHSKGAHEHEGKR